MLRFDSDEQTEMRSHPSSDLRSERKGLLFFAALVGSWVLALVVGWLVWRLAPF